MDAQKEDHRRFEIDMDAFNTFDGDHIASSLALFREGAIDKRMMVSKDDGFHAYATESYADEQIENMCYVLDTRLESAETNVEDIDKILGHYEIDKNLAEDIEIASDRALGAISEAKRAYELLFEAINAISTMREKYKNAFDELISEHHPEIPRAIEKAKLMNGLK